MSKLNGKFVWFECVTSDVTRAKGFYGELFGWSVQALPMGGNTYEMIANGTRQIGGYKATKGKEPAHWTSYLLVEDVDASVKKVTAAGGKVIEQPFDIPTVGRMALVADPQGATFWIMRGEGTDMPDAAPAAGQIDWNELWARDGQKALAFYQEVFGYTSKDMPMPQGTYNILVKGDDRAGIMTSPLEDVPPMWLPYVTVSDCDAVAARAQKLGGTVHNPPTDIPNIGRFAVLGDPLGATIAVIKLNAK